MTNSKICTSCKQVKPLSDFGKHKSAKDGIRACCRLCDTARAKNYRLRNPLKASEANKNWRKNNPAKVAEMSRNYRQRYPEKHKERYRRWSRQNSELLQKHRKRWEQKNQGAVKRKYHLYRARLANARIFRVLDSEIKRLYSMPCIYCGDDATQVDHVIPLARGGQHRIGNLVPSCARCNQSKGAKLITEWKYK
jgi:5-methylcytosine-specific restriction endonuclease McrA